ncbi:Tip elongation aberrant protein [Lachnellula occidentalis]|uniref:Tip elongation aberrant protein n=1 Tax=Lachnellula occidentalis TaxID=215460 RepID=A0A8H8UEQ0_9HELO|nr:Tip elongation aberrant protein [Lachnellula occidentalis]
MAFLFKSKKNADKAQAAKDGGPNGVAGSQSSLQSANGRMNEKGPPPPQQSSTPASSVNNSLSSLQGGSTATPSPEHANVRRGPVAEQAQDLPLRSGSAPPVQSMNSNPNASLYPWSQRRLTYTTSHPSPFPRYGAAVNSVASKEGDIYLMGGLINSSTVKGDLWMVEAGGNMACYPLGTTAEGPGPRVGHASLLVGNAFIVYGGDTKMEDSDVLDETLYLLNTSTRQWSRAVPAGPRPAGRYGHSLNIIGSKIYVFGGQVEGYFMNDLVAFDLNALQVPTNRWEMLIRTTDEKAVPGLPPARTNHSVVTYNEKLYLFGGTNGYQWFNDVWCYDPQTNTWSSLDCIGYIPAPREGHAAAIVDDVMYIFGGRTEEGTDLGDLAAFRISSRRWYTFQNMGPSPSSRSGHSMTAFGKQVVVLAGEPSTATKEAQDLGLVYLLDTSKIRYPNDQQIQQTPSGERVAGQRRPSGGDKNVMVANRGLAPRDGSSLPEPKRFGGQPRESVMGGPFGPRGNGTGQPGVNGNDINGVAPGSAQPQGPQQGQHGPPGPQQGQQGSQQGPQQGPQQGGHQGPQQGHQGPQQGPQQGQQGPQQSPPNQGPPGGSKLPRASAAQAPSGPPPQQQAPAPRGNVQLPNPRGRPPQGKPERGFGPAVDTSIRNPAAENAPAPVQVRTLSPAPKENSIVNGRRTPTQAQQTQKPAPNENGPPVSMNGNSRSSSKSRQGRQQSSIDSTNESSQSSLKNVTNRQTSPPPSGSAPARQTSNPLGRKGSARNSQTVAVLKELDAAKNRNAWYASELELARKAGYSPNPSSSPILDQRAAESFDDDDKPLIEALLAMKQELANVQVSIDKQAVLAAKQIAEVEKQRDAAVSEAVYAKAKLAAHSGSQNSTPQPDSDSRDLGILSNDRSNDINRKLAASLAEQRDLKNKIETLTADLDAEKRGRQLAEETATSAQNRMTELEIYKQSNSSEVERLKAELYEVTTKAREEAIILAEAVAAAQLIQVEKDELEAKYNESVGSSKDHSDTFESLREAVSSSADMRNLLERKLEEERSQREIVEGKLSKLRAEHEARTSELEFATKRLQDAEELVEQHSSEARTHRQAVLAGLDRVAARNVGSNDSSNDERSAALQAQVKAANEMVRKYQAIADTASDKLRSAEERIAGLEAYQEQASREGMSIRKQLQTTMREVQTLQAANSDMKHKLANQQLETNAVNVQHNTLKDILGERGISPGGAARARGLSSPLSGANTPDPARVRELEQQLSASNQALQETRETYEGREQQAEGAYREKLTQLENDYQSAVHYVKGTEKMLKRMKDELAKYKSENTRMKEQLLEADEAVAAKSTAPSAWEEERSSLTKQIDFLQAEMKSSASQLEAQMAQVRSELALAHQERDHLKQNHEETSRQLSVSTHQSQSDLAQLQQENASLEKRAQDAEHKVSLLLDQVESSVDNYRRQSRLIEPANINGGGAGGAGGAPSHQRTLSNSESVSEASLYGADNRNSMALDSLASELETLRTHWETTNKNYRLSNAFDYDDRPVLPKLEEEKDVDVVSLTEWRKRLDAEEEASRSRKGSLSDGALSPGMGKREMSPSGKEVGGAAGARESQVNVI